MLRLDSSPTKICQRILLALANPSVEGRAKAAAELAALSHDPPLAAEFIESKGLDALMGLFETGKLAELPVGHLLSAFVDLMEHDVAQWEMVQPVFIGRTASLVTNQSTAQDPRTLQAALSILENLVNPPSYFPYQYSFLVFSFLIFLF